VKYTIPEGTQTGTVFRLKSKGIPRLNSGGRGDQYVRVNIEIPKNLNESQKEILREFGRLTDDTKYKKKKTFLEKMKQIFS
jgi:molecular chaperone DnaJ